MPTMPSYTIPEQDVLKREILSSHQRCRSYGIDPHLIRNPKHIHLTPEELAARREQEKDFLEVATAQIHELYTFLDGTGFAVALSDKEGYMLDIIGDPPMVKKMAAGNCRPGYRWTERDVGTSAVSLALAREIPVQINDSEHFCHRGHDYTCSAAPVFGDENKLAGVLALSGRADLVHPHTLGMVITAARAIENQMRIAKTTQELLLRNNYMNALIDSIDSGVIAIDRSGLITQINDQSKRIFQIDEELIGKSLSTLLGSQVDWKRMMHTGFGYVDREVFIRRTGKEIQLIHTARPIYDLKGRVQGIIFVFNEINRIRKLVNELAGSQARFTFEDIIGVSPKLEEAKKLALLAAASKSTALLQGETGTGKELFAQAIHNQSDRRHHPFVAINCCAIPRELLESELFGYAHGAFTGARKGGRPGKFELADGGTVFLDEIGDMPTDMQGKLLRVLQTGELIRIGEHKPISIDVRILAATHSNLKQEVLKGNFREDLFYRLNVFPIYIPPLRERAEDVILLARRFLNRYSHLVGKSGISFSKEAEKTLERYNWPGNIRELENVVERSANLVQGNRIVPGHFGLPIPKTSRKAATEKHGALLEDVERQTILDVLGEMNFNLSKAAKLLGISRATLYKKIKKYDLPVHRDSV